MVRGWNTRGASLLSAALDSLLYIFYCFFNNFWPFRLKKVLHCLLASEIQLCVSKCEQVSVATLFKYTKKGGSYQATVTGYIDRVAIFHVFLLLCVR
jgi:hypothetical protein